MADILTMEPPAPTVGQASNEAASNASRYSYTGDMLKAKMPEMVKGAGFVGNGNAPLTDPVQITTKAHQAAMELRTETYRGYSSRAEVVKGMNSGFLNQFGNLKTALTTPSMGEQIAQLVGSLPGGGDALKSFTAGNLGIGTTYGLVPFDLLAP